MRWIFRLIARLGRALIDMVRHWWWRATDRCWACGDWPPLPGRHICQGCSLTHLRLSTGQIRTIRKPKVGLRVR